MAELRRVAAVVVVLLAVACSPSADEEGRVAKDGFSLVPPSGWQEPDDDSLTERFELVLDDPSGVTGRLGVLHVGGLDDVRAYMMDTTGFGAGLRGLAPEHHDEREVEVDGAEEARVLDLSYTAQVDGEPRVRAVQLVVKRDDGTGFDLRLEALEDEWESAGYDELADGVITSFRLR